MAFTYDVTTDIGKVRIKIADAVDTGHFLEDAEINFFLDEADDNINYAASLAAEAIYAQLSLDPDKKIGDLSLSNSQRAQAYFKLAKTLKSKASSTVSAFCGGISIAEKDSQESDSDRVLPAFTKGLHSYDSVNGNGEDDG